MLDLLPIELLMAIVWKFDERNADTLKTALRVEATSKRLRAAMKKYWNQFLLRVDFVVINSYRHGQTKGRVTAKLSGSGNVANSLNYANVREVF